MISDSTIMPASIICKTRNAQFVIPKNEDLRNISVGLHFQFLYFDRFKSGKELDIVSKILREAYSGFFPQEGLTFLFFQGGGRPKPPQKAYISLIQEGYEPP